MPRLLFAGSGEFAIQSLLALHELCQRDDRFELVGILTQPARPAGRGQQLTNPPLLEHILLEPNLTEIPRFAPKQLGAEAEAILTETNPDLIVVVDYGQFIPEIMLTRPKWQCLNIHASLLPRYRGAIPIPAAILSGDETTGVTIQLMEKKMDAGPILAQSETPISPKDNAKTLAEKLTEQAAAMLVELLPRWIDGRINPRAQEESKATFCYESELTPLRSRIDWSESAKEIDRHIRGFFPAPVAWTKHGQRRLRILEAALTNAARTPSQSPGQIIVQGSELFVVCQDALIQLQTVQPEGKKAMPAAAFIHGYRLEAEAFLV